MDLRLHRVLVMIALALHKALYSQISLSYTTVQNTLQDITLHQSEHYASPVETPLNTNLAYEELVTHAVHSVHSD